LDVSQVLPSEFFVAEPAILNVKHMEKSGFKAATAPELDFCSELA